jgi:hypothetical protein
MHRRHLFNLQPLLHNHQSYWHGSKAPRVSLLSVSVWGKFGAAVNRLHVRGSAVHRTSLLMHTLFHTQMPPKVKQNHEAYISDDGQ